MFQIKEHGGVVIKTIQVLGSTQYWNFNKKVLSQHNYNQAILLSIAIIVALKDHSAIVF